MQDVHPIGGGGGSSGGGNSRLFSDRRLRPHSHHHNHQALKCPRCDSFNTKFCYYNNYNLSQPRHFCKNCRRYWTNGGILRNVPVGGGCRKSKRSSKPAAGKKAPISLSGGDSSSAAVSATVSGGGIHRAPLETLVEPNQMADVSNFGEIGGFMNLIYNCADNLGFNGCDEGTGATASFSEFLQNQTVVQGSEILDPTVRIDDLMQNGGGFGSLDNWQVAENGRGLFDLPSVSDHQAYWKQTTSSSHHYQWSDDNNNNNNSTHHPVFLP